MLPSLFTAIILGCSPAPSPPGPNLGGGTVTGLPAGGTTTGTTTTDTTDTSTTTSTGPVFDCATIPATPLEVNHLGNPRGYHDVAFTEDGKIIGSDEGWWNNDLLAVDEFDTVENLVPGLGLAQQMTWLPDGDLAVAVDDTRAIHRVDSQGNSSIISPEVGAYGLIMGPDGKLWAANQSVVLRIDINTGAQEVVIGSIPNGQPRVLNFNRDFTKLYVATFAGNNGDVYQFDLNQDFDPVGGASVLASGVGSGSYHDGLGVDVCGYLYIPDYSTTALYRINPTTGQVQNLYNTNLNEYGHGIEWGNGVGPWRSDAIYLPLPYGGHRVTELVIGVPTEWDGVVINQP